ncbi:MAG: cell wall-binding repeat-containing protein [Acidimicrobiales bacterium]
MAPREEKTENAKQAAVLCGHALAVIVAALVASVGMAAGAATWSAQTSGTTQGLYGVSFADASHGWAVGGNGTILATTNGGATWAAQTSGTVAPLSTASFVDASHGWAVGNKGTVLSFAGAAPPTTPVTRLSGNDRIDTAVAVSQAGFPTAGSAQAAVVSRSDLFPDALAGVPLAAKVHGPLLLTPTASLDPRVETEIKRVVPKGKTVYLLGDDTAVGPAVAATLAADGCAITRHGGRTALIPPSRSPIRAFPTRRKCSWPPASISPTPFQVALRP